MLHPVPAVPRAVSLRSRLPRRWRSFVLLALVALAWPVIVVRAAEINVLSNPSVSPGSGTTDTSFTLSVHYSSSQGQVANRVFAVASGWSIDLTLSSGTSTNGTYVGARSLPAGTWPVEFRAESQGRAPLPVSGPTVTVVAPPTPTPVVTPTPVPTPAPTPAPTAAATPTPDGTASPARSATPRQTATPRRSASPRPSSVAPPTTAAPAPTTSGGSVSAGATATGAPTQAAASGTPSASSEAAGASQTPATSAPPVVDAASAGSLRGPLLVIGGGLTATGALVLGVQYARVRHRRRDLP